MTALKKHYVQQLKYTVTKARLHQISVQLNKFIFERRLEPSSSHISLHQLELSSAYRRSADLWF